MKKLFLFALPALMLLAAGCKDKNLPEDLPQTLSVNPELITCPDAGGDYTLTLTSPNGAWSATSNESWIRVTPTSGEKGTAEVRIKISPNKESAETKGEVTFTSGKETVQLPVTRAAKAAPYLRIVSDLALNTPKEGGIYTVQVESNIKWSASSNAGWAKVNKGVSVNNDNITVTVNPATTPEETTATITIAPYGEGEAAGTKKVTITRGSTDATSLVVAPTEINAPADGGSFTIGVSSNAKWRVYKTWDMDWLTLTGSQEGDGNGFFTISVSSATSMDDMSGIITIEEDRSDNYKPVKVEVAVTRKGREAASLSIYPTSISAPKEGGEYPVVIKSNYPWTATQSGNFFSISATSGDGDANIVVSIPSTSKEHDLNGYILIKSSFGNETAKIMIQQEGSYLRIIPGEFEGMTGNTLNVPADGGEYPFEVRTPDGLEWTATSSNPYAVRVKYVQQGDYKEGFWLHVYSPTDRHDDATVQITVKDGGVEKTINVVRESKGTSQYVAKPFSVSSTKQVYFSHGNLQYQASSNKWRFAKEQYDFIYEYASFGTVKNADNTQTSPSYNGWIDLFGWGTGNNPTLLSEDLADYSQFTDWGSNPIQDNNGITSGPNVWRTMSKDEWEFLLETRNNAANLKGVGGILRTEPRAKEGFMKGIILLPDNWVCPNGLNFNPAGINGYTLSEWRQMEKAGAVFLPYTGERRANSQKTWINSGITYWTSFTEGSTGKVYRVDLTIDTGQIYLRLYSNQYYGYAVRLIRDAN